MREVRGAGARGEYLPQMLWLILFAVLFYYLLVMALYFAAIILVVLGFAAAVVFGALVAIVSAAHAALKRRRSGREPVWPTLVARLIFFGLPAIAGAFLVLLVWSLTPAGIFVLPLGVVLALALPAVFLAGWYVEWRYPERVAEVRARRAALSRH
jgi:hypothetical protein